MYGNRGSKKTNTTRTWWDEIELVEVEFLFHGFLVNWRDHLCAKVVFSFQKCHAQTLAIFGFQFTNAINNFAIK